MIRLGIAFFLALSFIILLIMAKTGGVYKGYSDGERTGVITKISKKGLIFKSWEGDMLVGGMATNSDGTMVPATWQFSFPADAAGDALAAEISAKSAGATKVTIHYNQWWIKPIRLSTDYQADKIISAPVK